MSAEECARRILELLQQHGHRYYFRLRLIFGEVLNFAMKRGITPELVREMLSYGSYTTQLQILNKTETARKAAYFLTRCKSYRISSQDECFSLTGFGSYHFKSDRGKQDAKHLTGIFNTCKFWFIHI